MSTNIDELFKGMKEAPMFGRGNYMGEGVYEVEVKKVFVKNTFKGVTVFICEFAIVESNNDKHKPGSTGSWAPKIANPNTFGDIKSLMFAILGKNSKDVAAEDKEAHGLASALARAACGSDSAKAELKAVGVEDVDAVVSNSRIHLECTQTKTKEGKDFTRYAWSPSAAGEGGA